MRSVRDIVRDQIPKINPDIGGGYIRTQQETFEPFIEGVVQAVARRCPPGIKYIGSRRCTPEEEIKFAMQKRYDASTYEYAPSTLYLMRYEFLYLNQPLTPCCLYMPYFEYGDITKIKGSRYSGAPVLADRFISVTSDGIFVPLTCDRLNFSRLTHRFYEDGKRKVDYVIWSTIYHNAKTKPTGNNATVTMDTCVLHYLLCDHGLRKTSEILGIKGLVVGTDRTSKQRYIQEEYVIFETDGLKPKGYRDGTYVPTKVWLAVPRSVLIEDEQTERNAIRCFVASFFYIIDHFPSRATLEYFDQIDFWRILLGHAIFASREGDGTLLNLVQVHMETVNRYVDPLSSTWAEMTGLKIETFQDLLCHLFLTYTKKTIDAAESSTSMYGKSLLVHRYIFDDVVRMLFNLLYKLQPLFNKKTPSFQDVDNVFRKNFKSFAITRLNRASHPEIESVSVASHCMAFRMTTRVVLQGKKAETFDPYTMGLDVSIAEICNYLAITKNEPTGRGQINPYVEIKDGSIVRKEKFQALTDMTQDALRR
jgi:hypothetical protein